MKINFSLFLFILFSHSVSSQFGPGGVGNSTNNALWLKANLGTNTTTNNAPISNWDDMSGNGNNVFQTNADQRPLFIQNYINGYPSILFDNVFSAGQNDFLQGADDSSLDNTNGLTIFTVTSRTATENARSIIAKRQNVGVNQAYMFFYWNSDRLYVDIVSNNDRFNTTQAFGVGVNRILNLHYDGTLPAAQRSKVYQDQTLLITSGESSNFIPDYDSPLILGATHVGDNRAFGGYMSEIILYREALNNTQRLIVDNYLSAKYNIPLSANDFYTMDDPANGNFDHEMAGIGRLSATDFHDDAQGTSFVRMNTPSAMGDGDFLMWAHDFGDITANDIVDVDGFIIEARLNRVWRLSETGDVGTVNVIFDVSTFSAFDLNDLRLLIDRNGNGFFDNDVPPITGTAVGPGLIQFTAVDFQDGDYFTLGTINEITTPLPVELLDFSAIPKNNHVQTEWTTASESNVSHFEIWRSQDGMEWNAIGEVNAAGNSNQKLDYLFTDTKPYLGISYYKLKSVDFDGTFSYSTTKSVQIIGFDGKEIIVYPIPSSGSLYIKTNSLSDELNLKVYDMSGKKIPIQILTKDAETIQIDVSSYSNGNYIISIQSDNHLVMKKFQVHR